MKIGIASDHRGYNIKKELLKDNNFVDYGTNDEQKVDYVDYAKILCDKINNKEIDLGILICGTGIGMCISANKIKGIRCAKVDNEEEAFLCRNHNEANVIAISSKKDIEEIKRIIKLFIETSFSNEERHIKRIEKIKNLE